MNSYSYKLMVISFILTGHICFVHPSRIPRCDSMQKYLKEKTDTVASTSNLENVGYQSESKFLYAIIIDAGSTGSRAYAFKFKQTSNSSLELQDSRKFITEPGLSGYANNPNNAAQSISDLLDRAKTFVPQEYQNKTKLQLRATAGLRHLGPEKSRDILDKLKTLFKNCTFVTDDDSVGIMEGVDEGVFSWFTVNILQGHFCGVMDLDQTTAVIDLGGGSVQISYYPTSKNHNPDLIHQYKIMGENISLYSKSYANLGLMSGREGTYTKKDSGEFHFTSPCLHKEATGKEYTFGLNTFNVSGEDNYYGIDYENCKKKIKDFVSSSHIDKPKDLHKQKIAAISFFFGHSRKAGLVDRPHGETSVQSYFDAAKTECSKDLNESDAFMCLDLLYLAVLLNEGFGLHLSTTIYVLDTINNHKMSWALGAAFHLL